jgi:light-regulated signal transduction histidine kinase (bacteriophytochrome)
MVIRSDDLRFHNSCVLDIQQGADVAGTCLAAKKHKGELQVQSEVGNGTTFAISIPNSKGVNIFSRFS